MPKRLIARAPHQAAFVEYQERPLQPDEMRVQVEYASPKHGTELADFRGESPFGNSRYDEDWHLFLPREDAGADGAREWPLGNQWVGRITEIGAEVTDCKIGERVCGYGSIAQTQTCRSVHALKMPEEMAWQSALCYDPAQFALGAILDSHLRLTESVCVIGLGAIGQVAAQMATLAGASYVAVVDPLAKRREAALASGASKAFDPVSQDVGLELKKATGKVGVDVVIETSANESALQTALRGVAYGGTIAYVGWARPFKGGLDLGREAHFNSATVVFSRACSTPRRDHPRWTFDRICQEAWRMLAAGRIHCERIIDPVVPFEEAAEAYEEYVDRHPDQSIKLGVRMI